MQKKRTLSLDELRNLNLIIPYGKKIALVGDLGAGKTTFIRILLQKVLGKEVEVRSPTYTYYQELAPNIYHFDCYRIEDEEVFLQIGGMEILENPENFCCIEWPEMVPMIQKNLDATLTITPSNTDDSRDYSWSGSLDWSDLVS